MQGLRRGSPLPPIEGKILRVEKCLECDRYELEIKNLEQGIGIIRAELFKAELPKETKDKNFEMLLQLTARIAPARSNFDRHQKAHRRTN